MILNVNIARIIKMNKIEITEVAAKGVKKIMEDQDDSKELFLRFGVKGG